MQTCPGFFLKSLLESPGNLEICSVKFVDTLSNAADVCSLVECKALYKLIVTRIWIIRHVSKKAHNFYNFWQTYTKGNLLKWVCN